MGNARVLLACWLMGALCGCVDMVPATQVIVEITSDLALGEELSDIRVVIGSEDGENIAEDRPFELSPGASGARTLPLVFPIVPGPEGSSFRITVEGYGPNENGVRKKIVEQRAKVQYTRRKTGKLTLPLNRICKDVLCEESLETVCYVAKAGQTQPGECGPLPAPSTGTLVDPDDLDASLTPPPHDAGKDGGLDAAPAREAGPDRGGEAQEDAGDDETIPAEDGGAVTDPMAVPDTGPKAAPDTGHEPSGTMPPEAGVVPIESGAPVDAGVDRDGCIIWVDGQSSAALPSSAIQRGSELSFASWPNGQVSTVFHYLCQLDELGARLPGKLVSGYGCYAVHGNAAVTRSEFRIPTLAAASYCRVRWVESGPALPPNAVVAGESQGRPLVPCEARVAVEAFPIDAGDTYAAHSNDTHLGYTSAGDYRCSYEYVTKVHRADGGFSVLVWEP